MFRNNGLQIAPWNAVPGYEDSTIKAKMNEVCHFSHPNLPSNRDTIMPLQRIFCILEGCAGTGTGHKLQPPGEGGWTTRRYLATSDKVGSQDSLYDSQRQQRKPYLFSLKLHAGSSLKPATFDRRRCRVDPGVVFFERFIPYLLSSVHFSLPCLSMHIRLQF